MRLNYAITTVLVSLALPAMALAQSNGNNTAAANGSTNGRQFLQQVGRDSINEIYEALLAEAKAQDPAVRAYARLMVDDHVILASELGALSKSMSGFSVPTSQQQSSSGMEELQGKTGSQFDRTFIQHEVKQHEQSVQSWQREAQSNNGNSEVSAFAKLDLPIQQEHLALAQAIEAQLGNQNANR